MITGKEFRKKREATGLSRPELEKKIGVNWHSITNFEQGGCKAPRWIKIRSVQKFLGNLTVKHEPKAAKSTVQAPKNLFILIEDSDVLSGLLNKMNATEVAELVGCSPKIVELCIEAHGLKKPESNRIKMTAAQLAARPFFNKGN